MKETFSFIVSGIEFINACTYVYRAAIGIRYAVVYDLGPTLALSWSVRGLFFCIQLRSLHKVNCPLTSLTSLKDVILWHCTECSIFAQEVKKGFALT